MKKIEKLAAKEFRKLPKEEQKRRNQLRRLRTAPPSVRFEDKRRKHGRDREFRVLLTDGSTKA